MSVSKYFTFAQPDVITEFLPDSENRWWLKVRALNNRERKQREQIALRERRFIPKNERAIKEYREKDMEETALEYQVADIKMFEYEHSIVDFCLPYVPKGLNQPIDFKKSESSREETRLFFDNMSEVLALWVDEQMNKANRAGDESPAAEATKND